MINFSITLYLSNTFDLQIHHDLILLLVLLLAYNFLDHVPFSWHLQVSVVSTAASLHSQGLSSLSGSRSRQGCWSYSIFAPPDQLMHHLELSLTEF